MNGIKNTRIDIRGMRREQIVEAAVGVIAEQGLQSLSLSEIEKRAGMSRGQLTYYFPAKEDILLAVFDRLLELMYSRIGTPEVGSGRNCEGWDWVRHLLEKLLDPPAVNSDFHALQYTFLSQISHREDFRLRLASLYEEWRSKMAEGLAAHQVNGSAKPAASARALATLIQAILHGLAMQAAADPDSFQRDEMIKLCIDMVGSYLGIKKSSHNGAAHKESRPPAE